MAVATDKAQQQWIDLGTHTEACLTRPDTDGGCSISMWVRITACDGVNYVMTSGTFLNSTGFIFSCISDTHDDITTQHMG